MIHLALGNLARALWSGSGRIMVGGSEDSGPRSVRRVDAGGGLGRFPGNFRRGYTLFLGRLAGVGYRRGSLSGAGAKDPGPAAEAHLLPG